MDRQPDIVILGDMNLDWVVSGHLPFRLSSLQENGVIAWSAIEELPGGSGLNFARFSCSAQWKPLLIGCLGQDTAGDFLRRWLASQGIDAALQESSIHNTGRAFIARDAADIRLLVNNTPNANADLNEALVVCESKHIQEAAVLYISGYCIQERGAPRFLATLRAMELAKSADAPVVVLDVVPHRIYETYSFDEFLELTHSVDILISEVATMRRFLNVGSRSEEIDEKIARETMELLSRYYDGCILRYGPSGCDMEFLWHREALTTVSHATSHCETADKRGFGDRLAIAALSGYFGVLPGSRKRCVNADIELV